MVRTSLIVVACSVSVIWPCRSAAQPTQVAAASIDGAEIIAWHEPSRSLLVTGTAGVTRLELNTDATIAAAETIELGLKPREEVPSVAVHPSSGNLFAAAVISGEEQPGRVVIGVIETGEVLTSVPVGYHPDCVMFTPNGRRIVTADEGEPIDDFDPPGGLSIIDLDASDVPEQWRAEIITLKDLTHEPEYLALRDDLAYVTVQEASRLLTYRFETGQLEDTYLSHQSVSIDADDKDGQFKPTADVTALPQPDAIVRFRTGRGDVLALAGEGDPRTDEAMRAGEDFGPARLEIGSQPGLPSYGHAFGTRSVLFILEGDSVPKRSTGTMFEDLRSELLEQRQAAGLDIDVEDLDSRSDMRGPEPEGLAVSPRSSAVFVGLERLDAVVEVAVDSMLTPFRRRVVDLALLDPPGESPEGIVAFRLGGTEILAVACEGSGTVHLIDLGEP